MSPRDALLCPQSHPRPHGSLISTMAAMQSAGSETEPALPLADRVAIVTGGSRGIGRAIALRLASLGARLVLCYVSSAAQADLLAAQINSSSPHLRAIAVRADVSDPADVSSLFDRAESAFGGAAPHILIANAGIADPKHRSLADTELDTWDAIFGVNARGVFMCCQQAARRLARGGGGRIVTLSSSLVGALKPGHVTYTATKAAVEAMTKILAKELKGTRITANSVAPGPTATELYFEGRNEEDLRRAEEMNPFGRLGQPEDVAELVGFLCTDAGEWVNGQVIRVNGGFI